jgi:predicted DNA-binding transcriptional regulator YafY
MRHEKATRLLELARLLASTAEGLTLDEMAQRLDTGRRTAERMRDAVRELFPQMEEVDDPPSRRYRLSGGLDSLFQAPDADELAALRSAAETLASSGAGVRAAALRSLEQKVMASMRASARRRIAPDMEALVQAETIAAHAGPRPFEDAAVLGAIRNALKGMTAIRFRYEGGSSPGRVREVTPCGVLFGRANYLVAIEGDGEPRTWRLDRMREVEALGRYAPVPESFSIQDFADESFGIYHDAVEDVVLRIDAVKADDALHWRFHGNQTVTQLPDGRVEVAFRASGMLELAWHLFTWGGAVEIVSPPSLKSTMIEQLETALARYRS